MEPQDDSAAIMTNNQGITREAWLHLLAGELSPMFFEMGHPLPSKLALSVGFPSKRATSTRNQRIGECWMPSATADGTSTIFISPILADGLRVGDVLVHELIHAVLPPKTGHKGDFVKLMKRAGLTGKPTATVAGEELLKRLNAHINDIGPYPHQALSVMGGEKKQSTRLLKAVCQECGYTVRVTQKWVELGLPICPVDHEPMSTDRIGG